MTWRSFFFREAMFALSHQGEHRLATLSKATSQAMFTLLSHCLLGFPMTILLKLMYILRALDITYSALTRRKIAVSSEA